MSNPFQEKITKYSFSPFDFKTMFISEGVTLWERTKNQVNRIWNNIKALFVAPIAMVVAASMFLVAAVIATCGFIICIADTIVRLVTLPILTVFTGVAVTYNWVAGSSNTKKEQAASVADSTGAATDPIAATA